MSQKKKKKKPTGRTGFLLWQAGNSWQRQIKAALDPVGITHVQYLLLETLHELEETKQPVTQVRLARAAGTDVMMTSKVLRLLSKKKLIARKPDSRDARAFIPVLTQQGLKQLEKARKLVEGSEQKFFSKLVNKHEKFANNLLALTED